MSINIADNMGYNGKKPLDARTSYTTLALMKAVTDANMNEGCLAYCAETDKYYKFLSTNIVDSTTGKWREFETGGGDYTDLTNKPQIAGVTLSGNQSLASFGLTSSVETQSSGGSTKSYVNTGEKYSWNTGSTWYGTCTTSASTTAKSVTLDRGTLNFTAGAKIAIKFTYTNTASAPTLTVNSTTKNIKCIDENGNTYTPVIWWDANDIVEFVYDGTQFLMQPTTGMMFKIHGTTMDRENIYSTSEKVVGCWTDGRPLYQKTFTGNFPATPDGTMASQSIGSISNIKDTIITEGYYVTVNNNYATFPWITGTGSTSRSCRAYVQKDSSNVGSIMLATDISNLSTLTAYVTVQYTKTTDAANSFKYADPNEYSTTEKIIGTWIDGKTLYQKTISCGALPNNTAKQVSHGIGGNTFRIIEIQGRADNINAGIFGMAIPFVGNTVNNNSVECWVTSTTVYIATKMDLSAYGNCYITLKYTK